MPRSDLRWSLTHSWIYTSFCVLGNWESSNWGNQSKMISHGKRHRRNEQPVLAVAGFAGERIGLAAIDVPSRSGNKLRRHRPVPALSFMAKADTADMQI